MTDPQHEETFADTERKLREIITTLRAQLAEAHKDGSQLAAWQCLFDDGKTGIVCNDWGNQYCAMQRRADRAEQRVATLEAALAAQIEVDAGLCGQNEMAIPMDHTKRTLGGLYCADAWCGEGKHAGHGYADLIRNQPHDRTALNRHDAKTREKALREAYDSLFKHPGFIHAISGQKFKAVKLEDAAEAILALIEKEKTE